MQCLAGFVTLFGQSGLMAGLAYQRTMEEVFKQNKKKVKRFHFENQSFGVFDAIAQLMQRFQLRN